MTTNLTTPQPFSEIVAEIEAVMTEARTRAKKAFTKALSNVFVMYPDIKSLSWSQYTPYFNDGDSCEFSVGDIYVSNYKGISHYGEWDNDDEDEPEDLQVRSHYELKRAGAKYKELVEILEFMNSSVGEDVLYELFGDHVTVEATAEGIESSDYEHD